MDQPAWLGLGLGVVIGLAYGWAQRWGMGRGPKPDAVGGAFAGAIIRLALLLVVIYLALRFTAASRLWLIGAVMASYGVVFLAMMLKVLWKKN